MRATNFIIASAPVFLAALLFLTGCGSGSSEAPPTASISTNADADSVDTWSKERQAQTASTETADSASKKPKENLHPEVEITTNLGTIRLKLDAETAPQTVENFLVNYVDRDFYRGTIFHYVEKDYLVIAGGYTAALEPKSTRAPILNEARSAQKNLRGTVAMSRDPDYADSATSQFYFNLVDNEGLDFQESEEDANNGYCVFGTVVEGLDLLDRIAAVEVHDAKELPNVPVDPIVIESIRRVGADAAEGG